MKNRISNLVGASILIAACSVPLGACASNANGGDGALRTSIVYASHPGGYYGHWYRAPYHGYYHTPRYYYPRGYWSRPHQWRHHRQHDRWDRHDRRHDRDGRDRDDRWDGDRNRRGH